MTTKDLLCATPWKYASKLIDDMKAKAQAKPEQAAMFEQVIQGMQAARMNFKADGSLTTTSLDPEGKPVENPGNWSLDEDAKTLSFGPQGQELRAFQIEKMQEDALVLVAPEGQKMELIPA